MATRQFLMVYLYKILLHNWGDMSGLLNRRVYRSKTLLGAFVCMDRNRRYFIFTGRSTEKGRPHTNMQCRQYYPDPNAETNIVDLTIPKKSQHKSTAAHVANLIGIIGAVNIEKKSDTKNWSKWFNLSVFAVDVVNVWLEYRCITRTADTQDDLYNYLSG